MIVNKQYLISKCLRDRKRLKWNRTDWNDSRVPLTSAQSKQTGFCCWILFASNFVYSLSFQTCNPAEVVRQFAVGPWDATAVKQLTRRPDRNKVFGLSKIECNAALPLSLAENNFNLMLKRRTFWKLSAPKHGMLVFLANNDYGLTCLS